MQEVANKALDLLKSFLDFNALYKKGYRYLLLYFYPKDNTPGCTIEAVEFSRLKPEFEAEKTYIVGVSKDSERSHARFKEKHNLRIDLLSDPNQELIKAFGALKLKKRFGKEYLGVSRDTFLIQLKPLKILKIWRGVKAKGHASKVLEYLRLLRT